MKFFILILFLIIFSALIYLLKKEKEKNFNLKNLQDEDLRKRFEEEFSKQLKQKKEEIQKLEKEDQTIQQKIQILENREKLIQKEIVEKQQFNDSLFKIRTDELDRLIEQKKQEKELELSHTLQVFEEKKKKEYIDEYSEWVNTFESQKDVYNQELEGIKRELEEFQAKRRAVNEQLRREEELNNEIDFHRIILQDNDKDDISYLISIENRIHNKEILYKLIWSEYIQKPFNQMIKNICGNKTYKNVIYCIENINSHKKYIGKTSADVSKRWTEHVKNSLNIGGIKRQAVHDAMYGHWDEFTFSIIEEVLDEKLSEREKYYIAFFETDKYGYNLKSGG